MDDINTFLAQAKTSGEVESEGEFTLSADRAMEKLSQFRLLHRSLYVVHFVAAAVAAGATEFRVLKSASSIEFRFDKPVCDEIDLNGLLSAMEQTSALAWKRELAIGLNGIQAFDLKSTRLVSISSEKAAYLEISNGKIDIGPLAHPKEAAFEGTRIVAHYRYTADRLTALFEQFISEPPELKTLLKMCQHAPLDLWLDSYRLNKDVAFSGSPSMLAWRHIDCEKAPLRVLRPAEERAENCQFSTAKSSDYTAVLCLDAGEKAKARGLKFILNGISFARSPEILGFPQACGVVNAPYLRTNLSHSDLVEDDAFQELLASLKHEVQSMVLQRCEEPVTGLTDFRLQEFSRSLSETWCDAKPPASVSSVIHRASLSKSKRDNTDLDLLREAARDDAQFWQEVVSEQAEVLRVAWRVNREETLRKVGQVIAFVPPEFFPKDRAKLEPFKLLSLYLGGTANPSPELEWSDARHGVALALGGSEQQAERAFISLTDEMWKNFLLGTLELERERYDAAEAHLQKVVEMEPVPFFLNEYASLLILMGRKKYAYKFRAKAFESGGASSLYWPETIAAECRGVCPFAEWLKWSIRASSGFIMGALGGGRDTKWPRSPSEAQCIEILKDPYYVLGMAEEARFFFHQAVWGLRRNGRGRVAAQAVWHRLMAHSLTMHSDDNTYRVPRVVSL